MIEEDYVSFETAKLLKEKGFDEYCFCINNPLPDGKYHYIILPNPLNNSMIPFTYEYKFCKYKEDFITIPTLQIVIKWLREVHKCYITFTWEFKKYSKNYKPIYKDITWSFNIAIPKYNSARKGDGDYFDLDSDKNYDSYEQAVEIAIKYCLKNLI